MGEPSSCPAHTSPIKTYALSSGSPRAVAGMFVLKQVWGHWLFLFLEYGTMYSGVISQEVPWLL